MNVYYQCSVKKKSSFFKKSEAKFKFYISYQSQSGEYEQYETLVNH